MIHCRVKNRAGISLIEVLVALVILSLVLVALGGLMFQSARQTQRSAGTTFRTAAAQQTVAWIEGLAWDSLSPAAGCTSDSSGQLQYDRCVSVFDSTSRLKRITITITPTGTLTAAAETLEVYRTLGRPPSPLN